MPNKFWDSTVVGQTTTVAYPAISGDEPVAKQGGQAMKQHKIKHTHPPVGEDAPEIVYGFWRQPDENLIWNGDNHNPSLKLTRDLNEAIIHGATDVLIFKFDRVGKINIEVK